MGDSKREQFAGVGDSSGGASAAAVAAEPFARPERPAGLSGLSSRAFDILRYSTGVILLFALWITLSLQNWEGIPVYAILAFTLIALASELLPVTLPLDDAEITLTPIIVWGVIALFGPGAGIVVALGAAFTGSVLHKLVLSARPGQSRAGLWQYLTYNVTVIGITTCAGGLTYQALGGVRLGLTGLEGTALGPHLVWPLVAGTVVALSLDLFFYALGSAVSDSAQHDDISFDAIWMRAKVLWVKSVFAFLPSYVMFTPFAFVLAYLFVWNGLGFWGMLPILIPFFSLRQTLKLVTENIRAYRQTITTLAMLMQKYHPYTRGHLKRVADLSLRLARELRLPAQSQQWIWEAGLLHDIGKVGVPEQILDKTTKLTDEEWEIIKQHPVKSAEILSQLEFLDPIVPWVRHHHERVDGSGYPDGLKEGQMPIEAAIIAVADAFDAMTGTRNVADGKSRNQCDACEWKPPAGTPMPEECPECGATLIRVYRQPMTPDEGISQLRYGVDTQFSPRVVRAFIRMMSREGLGQDD
ncbi:MAG: HD-GYP domain-containing protein [Armatimonadota bacterium]